MEKAKFKIKGMYRQSCATLIEEKLKDKTYVEVIKNSSFNIAKGCFDNTSKIEQADYLLSSSFAVNFLMDIEPRLSNDIGKDDVLEIKQDLRYMKDVMMKDILFVMLGTGDEIEEIKSDKNHGDAR